ncbi:MAG TPA: hypothetical protein VGK90_06825 [Rhizomicrobium sp.]|jgi:hypothetical protein
MTGQGIALRLFGCLFAGFFAFLVCELLVSEFAGPSLAGGPGYFWGMGGSLGIGATFAWAFWKWPSTKGRT